MSNWKSRLSDLFAPATKAAADTASPHGEGPMTPAPSVAAPSTVVRLLGRRSVAVTALDVAPDALTLVAAHADGQVRLLRAGTGLLLHTMPMPGVVHSLALSADGRWLAVAVSAARAGVAHAMPVCEVRLVNLRHGTVEHTLEIPGTAVQALSFDPTGHLLAVAAGASLGLWDPWSGNPRQVLRGHVDPIQALVFSPDGQWLVSVDEGGLLQTWHTPSGQPGARLTNQGVLTGVAISGDSQWLAWGARDGTVLVSQWTPQSIDRIRQIEGQGGAVAGLRFSPDHRWLVIGKRHGANAQSRGTVRLWSTEEGSLQAEHAVADVSLSALAVSPCGRWLAVGGAAGEVCMIASGDGRQLRRFPRAELGVSCLALSADRQWLVCGRDDGQVSVWQPQQGKLLREMRVHAAAVRAAAFSADGRWWASGADDGTVLVWGRGQAHPLRARKGLRLLDFCPQGRWLALAGQAGAVQLLTLREPLAKEPALVHQGGPALVGLRFSAHGQLLLWADAAGKVTAWDPVSHQVRSVHQLPLREVQSLAFSDDLRWLAATSSDGDLLLWDLNTDRAAWQQRVPLLAGPAQLLFNEDATVLHGCGDDGRQWDWAVATGHCQAEHAAVPAHLSCRGLVRLGVPLHGEPLAGDSVVLLS